MIVHTVLNRLFYQRISSLSFYMHSFGIATATFLMQMNILSGNNSFFQLVNCPNWKYASQKTLSISLSLSPNISRLYSLTFCPFLFPPRHEEVCDVRINARRCLKNMQRQKSCGFAKVFLFMLQATGFDSKKRNLNDVFIYFHSCFSKIIEWKLKIKFVWDFSFYSFEDSFLGGFRDASGTEVAAKQNVFHLMRQRFHHLFGGSKWNRIQALRAAGIFHSHRLELSRIFATFWTAGCSHFQSAFEESRFYHMCVLPH